MKKNRIAFKCNYCGKETEQKVSQYQKSKYHFCSSECLTKWKVKKVKCVCEVCGKVVLQKRTDYLQHTHHYCSQKCSAVGTHLLGSSTRECEYCGRDFIVINSSPQRFCSVECQANWQKTQTGDLSSHYHQKIIRCENCGKEFTARRSRADNGKHHFCCVQCKQEWYATIWSQDKGWKEVSRERALRMLADGAFSDRLTKPQLVVNDILGEMGILYENEHRIGDFSIDNYLLQFELCIEVMGDYWHCSPIKYDGPINAVQTRAIQRDRAKRAQIEQAGSHVLYLWERDIMNREKICAELIKKYVDNCGKLRNYNSFNYGFSENGSLILNNNILSFQEIE